MGDQLAGTIAVLLSDCWEDAGFFDFGDSDGGDSEGCDDGSSDGCDDGDSDGEASDGWLLGAEDGVLLGSDDGSLLTEGGSLLGEVDRDEGDPLLLLLDFGQQPSPSA